MQSVKLTTLKRINGLRRFFVLIPVVLIAAIQPGFSQDNSPYSRYGIGDLVPNTNINTRAMGGISAGFADYYSVNFNNPASYSAFQSLKEQKSKKLLLGRAILDVGVNFDNRTLREPSSSNKFTASNAFFSYVQVAVPLRKNWGLSFGLRPVSHIGYNIIRNERLFDPITSLPIDSAQTRYQGNGGSYLASIGTGFSLFSRNKRMLNSRDTSVMQEKLSIGFNAGYYFGQREYATRRTFINDTVAYYRGNFETKASFGNSWFNAGLQYQLPVSPKIQLTLGAFGSLGQSITARQDLLRETYVFDASVGNLRLDSVYDQKDVKGKIEIPASYTVGFAFQKFAVPDKEGGWILGADFTMQNWNDFRYYGQRDSLRNNWQIRIGAQLNPVPTRKFLDRIAYRFGLYLGPDYVQVKNKVPVWGASAGLGIPLGGNSQARDQVTMINMAFEYGKRGNNDNLLRESLFRFSLGLSISDIWFRKRKYD